MLLTTAACSKGGNLVLEPGARTPKQKGSPFVQVNQGGKAYIQDTGGTAQGINGYISVQPSSAQLTGAGGTTGVLHKVGR